MHEGQKVVILECGERGDRFDATFDFAVSLAIEQVSQAFPSRHPAPGIMARRQALDIIAAFAAHLADMAAPRGRTRGSMVVAIDSFLRDRLVTEFRNQLRQAWEERLTKGIGRRTAQGGADEKVDDPARIRHQELAIQMAVTGPANEPATREGACG